MARSTPIPPEGRGTVVKRPSSRRIRFGKIVSTTGVTIDSVTTATVVRSGRDSKNSESIFSSAGMTLPACRPSGPNRRATWPSRGTRTMERSGNSS